MGIGDNLMATGMARGAAARGKRIAFGDGERIIWDQHSKEIFAGNPNVALPGAERGDPASIEWVRFHKGHRVYNTHDRVRDRWIWNMGFRPAPGEMFFDAAEHEASLAYGSGFCVIEPNVPAWKTSAANKQWGAQRWLDLARRMVAMGLDVRQFSYGGRVVLPVRQIEARSFRAALAILRHAALLVGPEGGLHHGAAAVGVPAVVIFGGFIPPQVTGYDGHINLAGSDEFCGSLRPCAHCARAMAAIGVDRVEAAVRQALPGMSIPA